ncbi:MAG: LamG-like jellyroll fold domain-containing protein [Kiritimatiellia bacterium]
MKLMRKPTFLHRMIRSFTRTSILALGILLGGIAVADPVSSDGYELVDLTDTIGSQYAISSSLSPYLNPFDNDYPDNPTGAGRWLANGSTAWVIWDFGTPTIVNAYRICPAFASYYEAARSPKDFQLLGKNENPDETTGWTQIDAQTNQAMTGSTEKGADWYFYVSEPLNATPFRYVKLNITANRGGQYTGIQEVELFDVSAGKPMIEECSITSIAEGQWQLSLRMRKNSGTPTIELLNGTTVVKTLAYDTVVSADDTEAFTAMLDAAELQIDTSVLYTVRVTVANEEGTNTITLDTPCHFGAFAAPERAAKKFTLTIPDTFDRTLSDFPLPVRLSPTLIEGFDYGDFLQSGRDMIIVDGDGNQLEYEIESWNPDGESLVWIGAKTLSAGNVFTIYYGFSNYAAHNAKAVWENGFKGIYHLNEADAAGTAANSAVGTADAVPGTADTMTAYAGGGILGPARDNGKTSLNIPSYDSLGLGSNFTVSAWFKLNSGNANWPRYFNRKANYQDANGWEAEMNNNDTTKISARGASGTSISISSPVSLASDWTLLTLVYSGTTLTGYINGQQVSTGTIAAATDNGRDLCIAASTLNSGIDEIRLGEIRSADEIYADWFFACNNCLYGTIDYVDPDGVRFGELSASVSDDGTVTVSVPVESGNGTVSVYYNGHSYDKTSLGTIESTPCTFTDNPAVPENAIWSITAYGVNENGSVSEIVADSAVLNGIVSASKKQDGAENGLVPVIFTVSRPTNDEALVYPLVVNLVWGGTAAAGVDFAGELPATVTLSAGESSIDIKLETIVNSEVKEDTTVTLAIGPGQYRIGESASATIENLAVPEGYLVWVATEDGLASDAANWSEQRAPLASDAILFDGRFSNANCTWDVAATHTVASWTQNNDYAGTVEFPTKFEAAATGDETPFTVFTITGACDIQSGSWTHPQSRTMSDNHDASWDWLGDLLANETYRLRVDCGSLTVGSGAIIDARGKGYYASHDSSRCTTTAHGGIISKDARAYGDPKKPIHIGMPLRSAGNYYNGRGGGAIYLTVSGAAVVDGIIRADSNNDSHGSGAAGSVYLEATSLTGTGTISAIGSASGEGNYKGAGGRVAIVTQTPVDRSTFAGITAQCEWKNAQGGLATYFGGAGTVYFKDATNGNGELVVSEKSDHFVLNLANTYRVTDVSADGDWTFDKVTFTQGGWLLLREGASLALPGGLASCVSTASDATRCGIRYEGGALELGSTIDQTIAGKWMFSAVSNYVFAGNLTVKEGGALGTPYLSQTSETDSTKLALVLKMDLEVVGDLTIDADSLISARNGGLRKERNDTEVGLLGYLSHGGRTLHYGKTLALHYQGYDSVFAPFLPGCGVPEPNGQGSGASGGVLKLKVGGTLTLDGKITANGDPESHNGAGNAAGGMGGAIDITARELVGAETGAITAEGGSYACQRGGGGRIAIKLTEPGTGFDGFAGRISASGRATAGNSCDASSGTVYLQTGDEADGEGTVRIAYRLASTYYHDGNTNSTEMVSLGYGGDDLEAYRKANYVVADYGYAAANTDCTVASVTLADNTAKLDLEGHTLTVTQFNYPDDTGTGLAHLPSGSYSAADLAALGVAVDDSSEAASGIVRVLGQALFILLR